MSNRNRYDKRSCAATFVMWMAIAIAITFAILIFAAIIEK